MSSQDKHKIYFYETFGVDKLDHFHLSVLITINSGSIIYKIGCFHNILNYNFSFINPSNFAS